MISVVQFLLYSNEPDIADEDVVIGAMMHSGAF